MTARLVALAVAWLTPAAVFAQHFHHHVDAAPEDDLRLSVCKKAYAPPSIDARLPKVPWEVATGNALAKQHFQQGLALYYGFNYEDALRNFKRATDLDETFLMGWWGRALAAGPNINLGIDDDCLYAAQAWADRAWSLAQTRSPNDLEYQLAKALLIRYSDNTVQTDKYADAMGAVWRTVEKDAHPNVGALYAESLMDKWPWDLWTPDKKPKHDDTLLVLGVLRAVTGRDTRKDTIALGAHHYFIHAVEAGPNPGEAQTSADFLREKAGYSGHLRHMPSHTYLLMGDYAAAVEDNRRATDSDKELFAGPCSGSYRDYIASPGCTQLYYGHYHAHDLFFRSVAESFRGKMSDSLAHARDTRTHVESFVVNEPGLQRYMAAPYLVLVGWGNWQVIVDREKEPSTDCYIQPPFTRPTGCRILRSMWHWAQGMAYTSKPSPDLAIARKKLGDLIAERDLIQPPGPTGWSNNKAVDVLQVAERTLNARIEWASGNRQKAIEYLESAVAAEDALVYDEPPQWLFPVRQSLGGAYLAMGLYRKAADVFLADLDRHRGSGRSLYGAYRAFAELGKTDEAAKREAAKYKLLYEDAWKDADKFVNPLYDEALWLLGMPAAPAAEGAPASGR